jgi:hypothetical protein
MKGMIVIVSSVMIAAASGCSDHHPDVWFDAGADAKAGEAGSTDGAREASATDTGNTAVPDVLAAVDVAADVAVDSSGPTSTGDAEIGD